MRPKPLLPLDPLPDERLPRDVLIATAGHVDHGKSTLIRVLTGTDPDRLPEECRREMTIELGFASLARPGGGRLAFIDVPGHDRLVETMVAGVGSIDAALLVVAADDGPMPQTIEHLTILRLLGVSDLIVALTRTDLVDDEWIVMATNATGELLTEHGFAAAPVIPVSSITGGGISELTTELLAVLPKARATSVDEASWLPIDRVFHRRGFGTIVAGTLNRGQLQRGDAVWVWPEGLRATVRGVESHGRALDLAVAGQRVAVNVGGINLDQVRRGSVLSNRPAPVIDAIDILFRPSESAGRPARSGALVRVVVGTERVTATIQFSEGTDLAGRSRGLARLNFHQPVATRPGDRLIIRQPSPATTIGGGVVLARYTGRPPRLDAARLMELAALAGDNPEPTLKRRLARGPASIEQLVDDLPEGAEEALRRWLLDGTIRRLESVPSPLDLLGRSSRVVAELVWLPFIADLEARLRSVHLDSPEAPGLPLPALRSQSAFSGHDLNDLLGLAVRQGRVVQRDGWTSMTGYRPRLRQSEYVVAKQLLARPTDQQQIELIPVDQFLLSTINYLERTAAIIRIDNHRIMSFSQFERVAQWVIQMSDSQAVDLPTVRDRFGLGRDATQRLLERLDELKLTIRCEDGRRPGPSASEWSGARHQRRCRRLGQSVLESRGRGTSNTSASVAEMAVKHETFVFVNPDDPIALITTGAALHAMKRTGRTVVPIHLDRSRCENFLDPVDSHSQARPGGAATDSTLGTMASVLELVNAVGPATDGIHNRIRIIAPLEMVKISGVLSLAGAAGNGPGGDFELLFYDDEVEVTGSGAALATRLGKLIDQGFSVELFTVNFLPEDVGASVDAIMADPSAVSSLALRFGLDKDHAAITNFVAGYHRSLTDQGLTERFWRVRGPETSTNSLGDRDEHDT